MRILLLTQWFDPEPTSKGLVFARELVRLGFDVHVLTGFPNYPGGKVYSGYRIKLVQREVIDGVRITRVPLYPDHGTSAVKRVLNYTSFCLTAFLGGAFLIRRVDAIYAYHPPLTVGIVACLLRFFCRTPVVYDIQDIWPDTLRATGMLNSERLLGIIGSVCRWVYRHVDCIVVLSPGFKKLLLERGVPQSKVEIIYNWADETALVASKGDPQPGVSAQDKFKIVFAGNMGKAQGLDTVLDAAALLLERNARIDVIFVGGGIEVDRLKARAGKLRLDNVRFLPPVPMSEVGAFLAQADALLVHLRKEPLFRITIPSKTQAYMCMGKPILMAVDGDAADLINASSGGVVVESDNALALADAAAKMSRLAPHELDGLGRGAKHYYEEHLALRVGVAKFAAIFRALKEKQP